MTEVIQENQQTAEEINKLKRKVNHLECQLKDQEQRKICLLYTSPSPRDATLSRMPSSA